MNFITAPALAFRRFTHTCKLPAPLPSNALPPHVSTILSSQSRLLRSFLSARALPRVHTLPRAGGLNSVVLRSISTPTIAPVVILHGFGSGLGFFFASMEHFVNRDVYFVDWLGMAGSDRPEFDESKDDEKAIKFFGDSLEAWCTANAISRATFVGHSLGGLLAARIADRTPDMFERLVLASPAGLSVKPVVGAKRSTLAMGAAGVLDCLWDKHVTPQSILRFVSEARGRNIVHRAVNARLGHAIQGNPELINNLSDYLFEINRAPSSGEKALNSLLQSPFKTGGIFARKPILQTPGNGKFKVDILFGDHDWMASRSALTNAAKIGNLIVMKNAGHHLYLDQAPLFAKLCGG